MKTNVAAGRAYGINEHSVPCFSFVFGTPIGGDTFYISFDSSLLYLLIQFMLDFSYQSYFGPKQLTPWDVSNSFCISLEEVYLIILNFIRF